MKNLLLILSLVVAFNANATVVNIVEMTNPRLDAEFLDAGVSSYDVHTDLYWLNFSDLVAGDLTLGFSVNNNQEWFAPQGWRLPTYDEVSGLFNTFFQPGFVDSGDGTMAFGLGGDLSETRNSWLMDFGTDAVATSGSNVIDDAIIHSMGLYLDEDGAVQLMGVEFNAHSLVTTIYGMDYKEAGLDVSTYYDDYGVFMVWDDGRHLCNPAIEICDPVVPIPAAIWLFGTGLLGLVAVARRKS